MDRMGTKTLKPWSKMFKAELLKELAWEHQCHIEMDKQADRNAIARDNLEEDLRQVRLSLQQVTARMNRLEGYVDRIKDQEAIQLHITDPDTTILNHRPCGVTDPNMNTRTIYEPLEMRTATAWDTWLGRETI